MKLLIASDIHGSEKYAAVLREIFEMEAPDKLVLLGDLLYHGPRNPLPEVYDPPAVAAILNGLSTHILAVRGNCDAEVDQMVLQFPIMADYALLFADGHTFYATHGHVFGPDNPPPMKDGDILLCGHTHVGAGQAQEGGFLYLNPGSITLPKDGHHSYMVYTDSTAVRKDLNGETLQTVRL